MNIQAMDISTQWVLSLSCPGGGGLRAPGAGDVSLEPAGGPRPVHGILARLVRSADLLLFQYAGSAGLQRETSLPLPYKVIQ